MNYKSMVLEKRALFFSIVTSILFCIAVCIGYSIDTRGEIAISNMYLLIRLIVIFLISTLCLYLFIAWINHTTLKTITEDSQSRLQPTKRSLLLSWLIIFLCWLPVFAAEYPGFFVYDATDEYVEVATRTFNTHHPLLHVLMLGGSVCGGNKMFGNVNAGIAIYTIFQMIIISLLFAWISCGCKSKKGYVCSLIWYGLFPTVVMFALCSAKDSLFAAAMVAAVILTQRILSKQTQTLDITNYRKDIISLGISLILMMLLRKNGVYAFIVYSIAVCIYVLIKNNKKIALFVAGYFFLLLASYKAVDKGLIVATKAQDIENQEILTVPIQQLARTWSVYKDEMSKEDLDTLYEILPEEALVHYTPDLSDPVKAQFVNEAYSENPSKYQKLWFKLLGEHPMSYINAWLNTCYGFFYPWTVVNVYEGHEVYTFTYTESSYFGYEVEYPGEREGLIPFVDKFYRWISLDDDIQRIPVVRMFFSMGALFWVYVLMVVALLYLRCGKELLLSMSLPGAVWLTLLLGPTFLPRYTVFLWFLLPWFAGIFIKSLNEENY